MEFKITKEQVLYLWDWAEDRDSEKIKLTLEREFPAAFEPEWEEVPLSKFRIDSDGHDWYLCHFGYEPNNVFENIPFNIIPSDSPSALDYKIEKGIIYRRMARSKYPRPPRHDHLGGIA